MEDVIIVEGGCLYNFGVNLSERPHGLFKAMCVIGGKVTRDEIAMSYGLAGVVAEVDKVHMGSFRSVLIFAGSKRGASFDF